MKTAKPNPYRASTIGTQEDTLDGATSQPSTTSDEEDSFVVVTGAVTRASEAKAKARAAAEDAKRAAKKVLGTSQREAANRALLEARTASDNARAAATNAQSEVDKVREVLTNFKGLEPRLKEEARVVLNDAEEAVRFAKEAENVHAEASALVDKLFPHSP